MHIVGLLLASGAKIAARNGRRRTPPILAARYGYGGGVQLLLKQEAGIEAGRDSNETALHFAVDRNREMVSLLIDSGADVDLHYAGALGRTQIAGTVKASQGNSKYQLGMKPNTMRRGQKLERANRVPFSNHYQLSGIWAWRHYLWFKSARPLFPDYSLPCQ